MNESRLGVYVTALGAFSAVQVFAADGNDLFFSFPLNTANYYSYNNEGWDVDGDGTWDYRVQGYWYWQSGQTPADGYGYIALTDYSYGVPVNTAVGTYIGGYWPYYGVNALPGGEAVGDSSGFIPGGGEGALHRVEMLQTYTPFTTPDGNMGFVFDIPGNSPYYGCAAVSVADDANGLPQLEITDVVYGDATGEPVTCRAAVEPRAVPVAAAAIPASLGLLAIGAAFARRRQRR